MFTFEAIQYILISELNLRIGFSRLHMNNGHGYNTTYVLQNKNELWPNKSHLNPINLYVLISFLIHAFMHPIVNRNFQME
jgi:hypothetical protein